MRAALRGWFAVVVACGAGLTDPGLASPTSVRTHAPRPNVLIFITDDQRAHDTLGVMPRTKAWFVRGGTRFTNAVATTPTCCPSRASIMTGVYAHNHGVETTRRGEAEDLDQDLTLQRYLRDAGYRTAIFGKYLNSWPDEVAPPHFDDWSIFVDKPYRSYRRGLWNVQGDVGRVDRYSTRFIESTAVRFLEEVEAEDGRPWLAFVTPLAPHRPALPHPSYERARIPAFEPTPAMQETDLGDKPPGKNRDVDMRTIRTLRRGQLRTLKSVDEMVDRIFRRLASLDELENTLAIFMSDNGFLWGEHGLMQKNHPYAASVGIPLLARWPGKAAPGATDDRLAANIDVAPTVLDAVGIDPQHSVDGRPLFGTDSRERVLLEHWYGRERAIPNWAALRSRTYLYVEHYRDDRMVPTHREYYDLVLDPWELQNLLGDADTANDPAEAAQLSLLLHRDASCSGTTGLYACP